MASPDTLNPAQRAAVEYRDGALLVLAGAGSGKTRVLTARIAGLLEEGVPAEEILGFTFTNRAAREMRERIHRAVGPSAARLWIGTFHGTGLRILRREVRHLGPAARHPDFVIYDREDQEKVFGAVLRGLGLAAEGGAGQILGRISDAKNALVTPEEAARVAMTPLDRRAAECYRLYQDALRSAGAFDFDDLIAEVVWLFGRQPAVHERYAGRFRHVLVDEYQDTNHAQFRLVEALARGHGQLFVVGDDDQSIYGWRGADLRNILDFEQAFPGAGVVRLEQNYRSTGNILGAANAVIGHNRDRKGKTLWCERDPGAPLRFVLARDENDEARRIAEAIQAWARRADRQLADCAVLYRTHAQSRAIETEFRHRGIAYELVGGLSFYQRREVKDLLAYLRLTVNPGDLQAFWRAWNTPKRGLGDAVRAKVEQRMAAGEGDPLAALRAALAAREVSRGAEAARGFIDLIDTLRSRQEESPDALLALVLERTGYLEWLASQDDAGERRANVEELVGAAAAFAGASAEPGLASYLAEAALLTDADRVDPGADHVLLLTAHNAKGLEFACVAVAGLEEGLFPHASSLMSPSEIEEERRLFYVAITRARDEVHLSAAAFRHRYTAAGFSASGGRASRFVDEIPADLLERDEPVRMGRSAEREPEDEDGVRESAWRTPRRSGPPAERAAASWTPRRDSAAVGREVFHESFGRGVVVSAEGAGADSRYTVRFGTRIKKVLSRFLSEGSPIE